MKNNWCIKGSVEFMQWVAQQKLIDEKPFRIIVGNDNDEYYSIDDDGIWQWLCYKPKERIITLQEYLDMNKKIIGYKVKSEFKQVAAKVAGVTDYDSYLRDECHFMINSISRQRLFDAQVLDLWCEEVYESKPKFKVGDIVVFQSELAKGTQWHTQCWSKDYILKIKSLNCNEVHFYSEDFTKQGYTQQTLGGSFGNNIKYFRHATPEEIKEYNKPKFKVGDIVVVTERHRNNPSKAGDIVEIRKIDDHTIPYYVYNKREDDCDWCVNVRKPTEAEVEEYNSKSKVFTINCDEPFEVEVSKQGIFYKNEDVWICPIDIGELLSISDDYSVQYDKVKINGASKKWDISINTVNIGCKKNCNIVDIKSVFDYYQTLQ